MMMKMRIRTENRKKKKRRNGGEESDDDANDKSKSTFSKGKKKYNKENRPPQSQD